MVENILAIAGPIGGLVAVVAVVLALIGHLYGRQVSIGRETVRKLRVGLEHDPSPGQLGQALRLWPEAAKYPGNNQRIELVKQANLDEARRVVHALTPATLEETSLPDAIGRLVKRFGDQTGMRVRLVVDGDAAPLATVSEVALLRFVQGALANVRSHSRAGQVAVTITYEADDVMVDVVDDGRGFDPATPRAPRPDGSGFGLRAMRERLAALGGRLEVESTPGDGTAIAAVLPRSTPVQEAGR